MDIAHEILGIKSLLQSLFKMVQGLQTDSQEMKRRMGRIELQLVEVEDTLEGMSRAVDKDAVTLIDHEQRISVLETIRV